MGKLDTQTLKTSQEGYRTSTETARAANPPAGACAAFRPCAWVWLGRGEAAGALPGDAVTPENQMPLGSSLHNRFVDKGLLALGGLP